MITFVEIKDLEKEVALLVFKNQNDKFIEIPLQRHMAQYLSAHLTKLQTLSEAPKQI